MSHPRGTGLPRRWREPVGKATGGVRDLALQPACATHRLHRPGRITSHHLPPLPPLLSPPRLLLFLRAVSASGEGFSAAGSVRDTTNTDFAVSVQRENDAV